MDDNAVDDVDEEDVVMDDDDDVVEEEEELCRGLLTTAVLRSPVKLGSFKTLELEGLGLRRVALLLPLLPVSLMVLIISEKPLLLWSSCW